MVVVDDMEASTNVMASKINPSPVKAESEAEHTETTTTTTVTSLSVEEALAKLPPIDHNALFNYDDVEGESAAPVCTCELRFVVFLNYLKIHLFIHSFIIYFASIKLYSIIIIIKVQIDLLFFCVIRNKSFF